MPHASGLVCRQHAACDRDCTATRVLYTMCPRAHSLATNIFPRLALPHTHGAASATHIPPGPHAAARSALEVARCGGSPLIRCGATTPRDTALVPVTGCAQRSPGLARRLSRTGTCDCGLHERGQARRSAGSLRALIVPSAYALVRLAYDPTRRCSGRGSGHAERCPRADRPPA